MRLPSDFRFEGDELYVTRDDATGDVVLSKRLGAKTWNEFFELLHEVDVPAGFKAKRPLNVLPQERCIFDGGLSTITSTVKRPMPSLFDLGSDALVQDRDLLTSA